jgi:hypothetical protein
VTQAIAPKERPLLFSGKMMMAILNGSKTQTRRIIKSFTFSLPVAELRFGDVIWCKETFFVKPDGQILYRAGNEDWVLPKGMKWKPSMFMPRRLSRAMLEITDVKDQRLKQISDSDAIQEGVKSRDEFRELWQSIHGPNSWIKNPWVWRYTFKRL